MSEKSANPENTATDLMIVAARGLVETYGRLGRRIPQGVLDDSKLLTSDEQQEFAETVNRRWTDAQIHAARGLVYIAEREDRSVEAVVRDIAALSTRFEELTRDGSAAPRAAQYVPTRLEILIAKARATLLRRLGKPAPGEVVQDAAWDLENALDTIKRSPRPALGQRVEPKCIKLGKPARQAAARLILHDY